MITKTTALGVIQILPDGQVQLRADTVVAEDGRELARTSHRTVLEPSADLPTDDPRLAAILRAVWTPEVIAAFAAARADTRAEVNG